MNSVVKVAIVGVLLASLSACGVRGSLEKPADAQAEAGASAGSAKAEKAHDGFVLDSLIE